jgi:HSP20 family protein
MKLMRFEQPNLWNVSPWDRLTTLRDEFNRLFEAPFGATSELLNGWGPAVDLYEDTDNLVVRVELPGMNRDQIEVSLHEGNLLIAGERKHEEQEGELSRSERFFGRFQRTISLPKAVDAGRVTAAYKDGILTITLPKTEEAKPKQIDVKIG